MLRAGLAVIRRILAVITIAAAVITAVLIVNEYLSTNIHAEAKVQSLDGYSPDSGTSVIRQEIGSGNAGRQAAEPEQSRLDLGISGQNAALNQGSNKPQDESTQQSLGEKLLGIISGGQTGDAEKKSVGQPSFSDQRSNDPNINDCVTEPASCAELNQQDIEQFIDQNASSTLHVDGSGSDRSQSGASGPDGIRFPQLSLERRMEDSGTLRRPDQGYSAVPKATNGASDYQAQPFQSNSASAAGTGNTNRQISEKLGLATDFNASSQALPDTQDYNGMRSVQEPDIASSATEGGDRQSEESQVAALDRGVFPQDSIRSGSKIAQPDAALSLSTGADPDTSLERIISINSGLRVPAIHDGQDEQASQQKNDVDEQPSGESEFRLWKPQHESDINIHDGILAYQKSEYERAAEIFEELASNGDARAQYFLGTMYYKGRMGEPNLQKAYHFLTLAMDGDIQNAAELRREVAAKIGIDEEKNTTVR